MTSITPENKAGKKTDLQYAESFDDSEQARKCYARACKRLQNPPVWHELCGMLSPSFTLVRDDEHIAHRLVHVQDRFRIEMPVANNPAGGGYDWVVVEAIEDNSDPGAATESFGMRLRASNEAGEGHFFTSEATSSFELIREGNTVTALYHGRNEVANTHTDSMLNNTRNAVVAAVGYIGLSEAQWYALVKGLLQEEIGG